MKPNAMLRRRHYGWNKPMGCDVSFSYVLVIRGAGGLSLVQPLAFHQPPKGWAPFGDPEIAEDTELWPVEVQT